MDIGKESKSLYFLKTSNENLNSRTNRPDLKKYDSKLHDIGM
jgi:hypothetical protein